MSALTFLGSQSLGAICPFAVTTVNGMIALLLPKLSAQLAGLLALQASLSVSPPTLSANLSVATQLLATLQASVRLGLPGIDFQVSAVAALLAKLQIDIAGLVLPPIFATAGIDLYAYDGTPADFGGLVAAQLGGGLPGGTPPAGHCNALLLVAESPAVWAAMQTFFKAS